METFDEIRERLYAEGDERERERIEKDREEEKENRLRERVKKERLEERLKEHVGYCQIEKRLAEISKSRTYSIDEWYYLSSYSRGCGGKIAEEKAFYDTCCEKHRDEFWKRYGKNPPMREINVFK